MSDRASPLVLYVEDDRIHLILMEEVFRLMPELALRCADSGEDALAALAQCRPDVLLVDMNLSDMTGIELRTRVAADAALSAVLAGARWVALSADDPPDTVRAAREAGFDAYWLKPIDVLQLQAGLRELLASRPAQPR
jgi:two-component system sensor histidine kinase TorS